MSNRIKYIYFSDKKKKNNWCNNSYNLEKKIENLWNNVESYFQYTKDNYNENNWNKQSFISMSYSLSSKFILNENLKQLLVEIPNMVNNEHA